MKYIDDLIANEYKQELKDKRRESHCAKLAKLNAEDKSGNHRPRRPVKSKLLDPSKIDFGGLS